MGHQRRNWPEDEDDILTSWYETAEGEYRSGHDRMLGRFLGRSAISVKCRRLFLGLHADAADQENMGPLAPWPDVRFENVRREEARTISADAPPSARYELPAHGSTVGCSTADLQESTEGGLTALLQTRKP